MTALAAILSILAFVFAVVALATALNSQRRIELIERGQDGVPPGTTAEDWNEAVDLRSSGRKRLTRRAKR